MSSGPISRAYPRLGRRIYAAVMDGVIALAGILVVLLVIGPLEPGPWVIVTLIVGIALIEPVLVSTTEGSIGHHVLGIRIISRRTGQSIGILRAIARMIIRGTFGVFSLLFMGTTKEYRALHDIFTGSIVVLRDPASMPASAILLERQIENPDFVYPSLWRRILFIFLYAVLAYFAVAVALAALLMSDACHWDSQCTHAATIIVGWIFLIALSVVMVQGVRGRLPGARRQRKPEVPGNQKQTPDPGH